MVLPPPGSGVGSGGVSGASAPRQRSAREAKWGENKYFKRKNFFLRFINFKLLSQMKVNSSDGCDF